MKAIISFWMIVGKFNCVQLSHFYFLWSLKAFICCTKTRMILQCQHGTFEMNLSTPVDYNSYLHHPWFNLIDMLSYLNIRFPLSTFHCLVLQHGSYCWESLEEGINYTAKPAVLISFHVVGDRLGYLMRISFHILE